MKSVGHKKRSKIPLKSTHKPDERISQNKLSANFIDEVNNTVDCRPDYITSEDHGSDNMSAILQSSPLYSYVLNKVGRRREANQILFQEILGPIGLGPSRTYFESIDHINCGSYLFVCNKIYEMAKSVSRGQSCNSSKDTVESRLLHEADWDQVFADRTDKSLWVKKFYEYLRQQECDVQMEITVKDYNPKPTYTCAHPIVVACRETLHRKGSSEQTSHTRIELPGVMLFRWLIKNVAEFNTATVDTIPVWKITQDNLLDFRSHLKRLADAGRYKHTTVNQYLAGLSTFFSVAYSEGRILHTPMEHVKNIEEPPQEELVLPDEHDRDGFFYSILRYSDNPVVDFTAFLLMLALGMREMEVAMLKWENIDLESRTITFWRKGNTYHTLPLPECIMYCLSLLQTRKSDAVFSDKPKGFKSYLYSRYKVFGILSHWETRKGGPHIFRHIFISGLTAVCQDVRRVMYIANHQNETMVMRYTHRSESELKSAVNLLKIGDHNIGN